MLKYFQLAVTFWNTPVQQKPTLCIHCFFVHISVVTQIPFDTFICVSKRDFMKLSRRVEELVNPLCILAQHACKQKPHRRRRLVYLLIFFLKDEVARGWRFGDKHVFIFSSELWHVGKQCCFLSHTAKDASPYAICRNSISKRILDHWHMLARWDVLLCCNWMYVRTERDRKLWSRTYETKKRMCWMRIENAGNGAH